jgi:hypothetical protein
MDEIVSRLPELEQTWGIWSDWSREHLGIMTAQRMHLERELDSSKDGNHSTHICLEAATRQETALNATPTPLFDNL